MKKDLTLFIIFLLILSLSSFGAIDYSGDFSSRSTILNALNKKDNLTPEQKDLLRTKKLSLSPDCLFKQVKNKKYENVELLLSFKINPNQSYYGDYPIYAAAKNNDFKMVKLLMDNGAKLDRGFYSEFYEAVKHGNQEMAMYFYEKGAKINYCDSITNETIVYQAIKHNMLDLAKHLIDDGAYADIKTIKLIKKKHLQYLIEN